MYDMKALYHQQKKIIKEWHAGKKKPDSKSYLIKVGSNSLDDYQLIKTEKHAFQVDIIEQRRTCLRSS